MRRLDYNKIMCVLGAIFIILFCTFTIRDYINYDGINNSAPFYVFVIIRIIEFMLPGILFIYLYNQNTYLKESYHIVKSTKLEQGSNYKIAQISDFHNTNSKRIKTSLIQKLKENKPNIIVITGDLIDSRRTNISAVKEFVEKITNIAPVYYVLGNHESRFQNIKELEQAIQKTGAKILRNKVINLTNQIQLIGMDDPAHYVTIEQKVEGKMEDLVELKLKGLLENNNMFKVLIAHRPELIDTYAKTNVDIVFTGRAHGGQIRIPGIGGIIAPGQDFFPKYTKGIYRRKDTRLVVSRGIGNSKFPFRVNNRPELIFVTLERGNEYEN